MVAPIVPNLARTALTQLTGRSSGDSLQSTLQALGMNQNMAALQGAMHDLSQGNLAGYQKNLFEAFTGVDPGRIQARMAKPFSCGRPSTGMGVQFERMDLANKKGKLAAFATGFALGGIGGGIGALIGKNVFARMNAKCLEKKLGRDPAFRAQFEAQVGGRYIPDGRTDGKITLAKPNFNLPGLNPGIFGAMAGNMVAGSALSGIARMMGNAASLMQQMTGGAGSFQGFGQQTGGLNNTNDFASKRADSAVARLGPGATFEDLVAAFMIDTVKDIQKEVEDKMKELKSSNESRGAEGGGGRGGYGGMLGGLGQMAGGVLGGMFGGPIGAGIGKQIGGMAGNALGGGGQKGAQGAQGGQEGQSDMRQIQFEELKNLMNKLQQMIQSMSNVLNTMHQGAMNSIRNIRA